MIFALRPSHGWLTLQSAGDPRMEHGPGEPTASWLSCIRGVWARCILVFSPNQNHLILNVSIISNDQDTHPMILTNSLFLRLALPQEGLQ